jgi:hypothetical protein
MKDRREATNELKDYVESTKDGGFNKELFDAKIEIITLRQHLREVRKFLTEDLSKEWYWGFFKWQNPNKATLAFLTGYINQALEDSGKA